jgi:hypothetical protein
MPVGHTNVTTVIFYLALDKQTGLRYADWRKSVCGAGMARRALNEQSDD